MPITSELETILYPVCAPLGSETSISTGELALESNCATGACDDVLWYALHSSIINVRWVLLRVVNPPKRCPLSVNRFSGGEVLTGFQPGSKTAQSFPLRPVTIMQCLNGLPFPSHQDPPSFSKSTTMT